MPHPIDIEKARDALWEKETRESFFNWEQEQLVRKAKSSWETAKKTPARSLTQLEARRLRRYGDGDRAKIAGKQSGDVVDFLRK